MLQAPSAIGWGARPGEASVAPASDMDPSERNATSPTSVQDPPPSSTAPSAPKQRSCVLCRTRKVRCDKQSPCTTCRRAKIACVFPSNDRPPRWARRLDRLTDKAAATNGTVPQEAGPGAGKVMDRLKKLEQLVKELSGQLEQAHASASLAGSPELNAPASSALGHGTDTQEVRSPVESPSSIQKQFGRLVVQDANQSRYVSSGFWSRVNDEVCRLSCSLTIAFALIDS